MKICYILYFDENMLTGAGSHARGLINAFTKKAHIVTLFSPSNNKWTSRHIKHQKVFQLKVRGFYTLSYLLFLFPKLFLLLKKNKFDFIYVRYFNFAFALLPLFKLFKCKVIFEHNADVYSENIICNRNVLSKNLHLFFEKLVLKSKTSSIVVTKSILDQWKKGEIKKRKVLVLNNAVDTNIYRPIDTFHARETLNLDKNIDYIAYVGQFSRYQGIGCLLKAFHIFNKKNNVRLLIVGGSKRELIDLDSYKVFEFVEDSVVIFPKVSEEVAALCINSSTFCVAPYNKLALLHGEKDCRAAKMKGDPLKIYSYMACKKPVIATHYKEAGHFINSIHAGISVPSENPAKLAFAMSSLFFDKGKINFYASNAYNYILNNSSWDMVASKTISFASENIT